MDAHPIPQDVTGFQFKLIGEMTVKQFAYIAAGAILAWIFFVMPISILIKLPLSFLFATIGFSLAFIPFQGRPLDVMIMAFIKALFTPNQYVFQKVVTPVIPNIPSVQKAHNPIKKTSSLSEEELQTLLTKSVQMPKNQFDTKEDTFLNTVSSIFKNPSNTQTQTISFNSQTQIIPQTPIQNVEEEVKENIEESISNEEKTEEAEKELEKAKIQEVNTTQNTQASTNAHQKVLELEKLLNETLAQKKQLEEQLLALQQQLDLTKTPPVIKQVEDEAHVKKVPKEMGKSIGIPIADDAASNVIMGIVKDPRGNVLPNILVEVKDQEGNPVRAFKTNRLGQFASATPILNGTYTITFEDTEGTHMFDSIELVATGQFIPAIEVKSHDAREELRKFLFQ